MSRKAETLSSLLRIALITLILGQGIPAPVYGAGDVNLRCRPPYSGNPNNVTSLTARTDFSIQRDKGKVLLEWTAPSDAGGNDVFSYVIRYATFSVTEAGGNVNTWLSYNNCLTAFDPDLPVSWGKYATAAAGTTQRYTLSGLDPGTYYYFAVQAIDRYNRHSTYDTQVQGVSTQANAYATTPPWWPYNITNLTGVSMPTPGYVSLQWSAPVFIDTSGFQVNGRIYQPGEYCIQYSTTYSRIVGLAVQDITLPSQINLPDQANNWVGSNRIYFSTRNFNTGDLRSIVLSGLTNETTYYFHIFTRNEWPEWSYVSIPRCDVMPYISMPPVNGLSANDGCVNNVNIGHYVNVTWTNPNEPFISGVVVCYSSITYPTSSAWPTRTVMT